MKNEQLPIIIERWTINNENRIMNNEQWTISNEQLTK